MNRVACLPKGILPKKLEDDTCYFSIFENSGRPEISTVGTGLLRDIEYLDLVPSPQSWDFMVFALAVAAADLAVYRTGTVDGWTRMMELEVALANPAPFIAQSNALAEMLRFLTGDYWRLKFVDGGVAAPNNTAPGSFDADCVALLSGGADSLVGGIDLSTSGRRPLFVSQISRGDAKTQITYAKQLGGFERHIQWNHNTKLGYPSERSTRARSIVFFAFAALAGSTLANSSGKAVEIYVPENGFISLNVSLNPGRAGSLSTKTTHPIFLGRLEAIWQSLGISASLLRPYAFKTKGEMFQECANPALFQKLVGVSTSCGRYLKNGYTQCGRCIPCLVRRAAFVKSGIPDSTPKMYKYADLASSAPDDGANDIGAVAAAVAKTEVHGVRSLTAAALSFADSVERPKYQSVVERGFQELGVLLREEKVLK
jgi:hypothetical protein